MIGSVQSADPGRGVGESLAGMVRMNAHPSWGAVGCVFMRTAASGNCKIGGPHA